MEAIGSEVGLKMRSAIKAKLMELGCYVDDELPDYVMVMVANKRTRSQMEDDLQLFLSNNTEAFVSWLHQVLQKLQEVTINTKIVADKKKSKHASSGSLRKEPKEKKKDKLRSKDKAKVKAKKSKKEKSKKTPEKNEESESIRPNVPRLLMNLEKESSPSITDVFAGQILKKHGITSNSFVNVENINLTEIESASKKLIRNRFPIIDPATVSQIEEADESSLTPNKTPVDSFDIPSISEISHQVIKPEKDNNNQKTSDANLKKVQETVESDSEYDDYLNIRTENEDLIVDLEDDIPMSSNNQNEIKTPPLTSNRKLIEAPSNDLKTKNKPSEREFQQIELKLPKRPLRERLGVRESNDTKKKSNLVDTRDSSRPSRMDKNSDRLEGRMHMNKLSSESFGNERSIKSRLTLNENRGIRRRFSEDTSTFKRKISSRVVPLQNEPQKHNSNSVAVASVVRAPPRPKVTGISAGPQMLLRAMADAQKSLLNMPPKKEIEPQRKKVHAAPNNRKFNPQKIIIEVSTDRKSMSMPNKNNNSNSDVELDIDTESLEDLDEERSSMHNENEYIPVGSKIKNYQEIDYVPTHIDEIENKTEIDPMDIAEIPKILNSSSEEAVKKPSKNPQFVVTLDGLDPNIFLEKKLEMINRESDNEEKEKTNNSDKTDVTSEDRKLTLSHNFKITFNGNGNRIRVDKKDENSTSKNVDINTKKVKETNYKTEKSVASSVNNKESTETLNQEKSSDLDLPISNRKRKASPIVFNIDNANSSNTKVTTVNNSSNKSSKYDSIPSLPSEKQRSRERCKYFPDCRLGSTCEFYHPAVSPKQTTICRVFPACTFGDKCVYTHPPCKFDTSCIRKDCPYSHTIKPKTKAPVQSVIASHVVPGANYKTISSTPLPSLCKYHPNCSKVGCNFYHPVPCRFGKKCLNKVECNFFHHNISSLKWKSPHAT